MNGNYYKEYCTGCGLCHSVVGVTFSHDERGYNIPNLDRKSDEVCEKVCPCSGYASTKMDDSDVWGRRIGVYLGWSLDDFIRQKASSGGVLTSICCYLIEHNLVDGIIQTRADSDICYKTETVVSKTVDEVLLCMGSRYAISSPLSNIKQLVKEGHVYAFVGKPCDASALRMQLESDEELKECIKYIFSFFCAGEPSDLAQLKLLQQLGCKSTEECTSLQYRGNGWPGYATAVKRDGTCERMTYNDSWGIILGRDIRRSCRICLDGIGEFADISCGDAWYMTADKTADFTEGQGRNVIFTRTNEGEALLQAALKNDYLHIEAYEDNIEDLNYIQKYQFERRTTMGAMILAMKLLRKDAPQYDRKILRFFSSKGSLRLKLKRFLGTYKRIKQGRI